MPSNIAFPMYDVFPVATDALAAAMLRQFPGSHFLRPAKLLPHWRDEHLLLSQTCGYPLVTLLPDVQVVGQFHYTAAGCDGGNYRSKLLIRNTDKGKALADFRGRVAACNSPDSQSGYRALLNSTHHDEYFFRATVWTGSHRLSLKALQTGSADIAAIDCVSLALFGRYDPLLLKGLSILGETALTPGLPLITSKRTSAKTLEKLRAALSEMAERREIAEGLLIGGFSPASRRDYDVLLTASSYA